MIRKTKWHHPFLLKFDHLEGFHQPPLTYDAQIIVCWVGYFAPAKTSSVGFYFSSLKYHTNLLVTPEDQVISASSQLTDTLQGIKSPQLHTFTLQALGDLHNVILRGHQRNQCTPLFKRHPLKAGGTSTTTQLTVSP